MEIQLDREEKRVNVNKIMIATRSAEWTIYIDSFGELIINKEWLQGESSIIIRPKVANEISLQ
jgi:hypothetical protein